MLLVEEKEDVTPICPYCSNALKSVWCRTLSGLFGKRYIYVCPDCKKVLGVTHRKGFWMG